jgi:RNA recognition motif-containing protein
LDKTTTSFFVTNLPEDASSGDIWKLFVKYGRIGEVFFPKKLDKRGRRFCFVKFKEVQDVEDLSERLRDVWIGSFKLWINRSRFARSETPEVQPPNIQGQNSSARGEETRVGKSFRSALLGGRGWWRHVGVGSFYQGPGE